LAKQVIVGPNQIFDVTKQVTAGTERFSFGAKQVMTGPEQVIFPENHVTWRAKRVMAAIKNRLNPCPKPGII
jgi:hypothetical protein